MLTAVPDPTALYRLRDGVYAADLLVAAVAELDLFSWLAGRGPVPAARLRTGLGLTERPTDGSSGPRWTPPRGPCWTPGASTGSRC